MPAAENGLRKFVEGPKSWVIAEQEGWEEFLQWRKYYCIISEVSLCEDSWKATPDSLHTHQNLRLVYDLTH